MPIIRILAALAGSAILTFGAEAHGTWSASSSGGQTFGGTWTAEAHQSGGVTGTWRLLDASGKIVMRGGWSASKSPREWSGAWRATVEGRNSEYSGTWTAIVTLGPDAQLPNLFESALRAVVSGTWKSGGYSGAWSIRAMP